MRTSSKLHSIGPLALAALICNFAQGQTAAPVGLEITAADFAVSAAPVGQPSGAGFTGRNSSPRTPGNPGASSTAPGLQGQIFYPMDVSNPHNMPTIDSAQHHPIYVNEPPSHWPNVAQFLADLGAGQFIHILDQYVNSSKDNRYTLGTQFGLTIPVPSSGILGPPEIFALLHAAAVQGGSGYGHIYHIFVPQGVGLCYFGLCNTPSNPSATNYCAFHGSVIFSDAVGHVVFTVQPYQDNPNCLALPGTPNGQLADTTYTFLSHEVFETISDPNGDAWWVHNVTFAWGYEIADLCQRRPHPNVTLNGHIYNLQAEYSNQFHGCAYSLAPDGGWSN